MKKTKILKLKDDIDIRDITVPLILHFENKKNYTVQVNQKNNNFSLQCKSRGLLKTVIALSVKFNIDLEKKENNLQISFYKTNWIYKIICLIIGAICFFIDEIFVLGAFLLITSLSGLLLLLWNKLAVCFYIKKCIKKQSAILTADMFNSFSSYLKVIDVYGSLSEFEQNFLAQNKKNNINNSQLPAVSEKSGLSAGDTNGVKQPEVGNTVKIQNIFSRINFFRKVDIKKIIQIVVALLFMTAVGMALLKFKQESAGGSVTSEQQFVENEKNNNSEQYIIEKDSANEF